MRPHAQIESPDSSTLRQYFCLPLIETQVDPVVWADGHIVGKALTVAPFQVHLKDPS
jgi:hypothetical protein